MMVHRILAEDGEETVYFAKTGKGLYILEIHTVREGGIQVSFTELDQAGALELRDAITHTVVMT